MNIRSILLTATIALFACGKSDNNKAQETGGKTIRVTGIPDENPNELSREYAPMVELLEAALGSPVEYIPLTDYGAAVQALAADRVDFAWLGGFTHVQSRTMADVVPLVMRDIDRKFHSVFVINVDSGITSMAELKGKTFAFGSKSSTSGHLMPRHFLQRDHNIDPLKDFDGAPVYSGAHDATAKMVESGKVQAGVLNMQVWDRLVKEDKIDTAKVTVLWKTPAYIDYVWTARSAVPADIREKFAQVFLTLSSDEPKQNQVLTRMGAKKYVRADKSDFDAIEAVARSTGLLKD